MSCPCVSLCTNYKLRFPNKLEAFGCGPTKQGGSVVKDPGVLSARQLVSSGRFPREMRVFIPLRDFHALISSVLTTPGLFYVP